MISLALIRNKKKVSKRELALSEDILEDGGVRTFPLSIPEDEKGKIISSIHDFLGELAFSNQDNPYYWYTPVSEMQPFMSKVYRAIEVNASLKANVKHVSEACFFFDKNIFLLSFLKKSLKDIWRIEYTLGNYLYYYFSLLKISILRYTNVIVWLKEHLLLLLHSPKADRIVDQLDYLFVSRFEKDREEKISEYEWYDTYLGEMPSLFTNQKIAIIGRCGGDPKKIALSLQKFKTFPIWTIYQHLTIKDVFVIFFAAIKFKLKISHVKNHNLARFAYQESRNHCRAIADCLLVEKALGNLLKKIKVKKIVTMQENCAWENAVIFARNKCSSRSKVIGYFHCPVIPSSFRYHIRKDTLNLKPHPDTILTLGSEMSASLKTLGEWDNLLVDGYAFRAPELKDISEKKNNIASNQKLSVLVLLGGNYDNCNLLKWLYSASLTIQNIKCEFLIKGHPRMPAASYLKLAGITDKNFVALEQDVKFKDIISKVNCIFFKGTTAGFIGLAAGLPNIHYCHNGLLTDNVLFNAKELCYTVRCFQDLSDVFKKIVEKQILNQEDAKHYVFAYYDQTKQAKSRALAILAQ